MIEIVQAGQAGKTKRLFEMHRLRKRVFSDRMHWPVTINEQGLEIDQFDIPEAVYLLSVSDSGNVVGSWRLLPTLGPTMIRDIWPQFLDSNAMPSDPRVWEVSRFSVDTDMATESGGLNQIHRVTGELFCALTELCIEVGITEVFTLYDNRIARILRRLNCVPNRISDKIDIGDRIAQVGSFYTNQDMLSRLRHASGIYENLIDPANLPPIFSRVIEPQDARSGERELAYAQK